LGVFRGFLDTPANRKLAEFKAREIEKDILYERFDPTLGKYKPELVLSTVASVRSIAPPKTSLAGLWEKFIEFKRPQCSPNTMKLKYSVYTNYLKSLPTHDLKKAGDIRNFVEQAETEFYAEAEQWLGLVDRKRAMGGAE
jgi:integrase